MIENLLNIVDYDDVLTSDCSYLCIDDDNDKHYDGIDKENDALIVAHLNIHGLISKNDDFKELLSKLDYKNLLPDMILLCETFLTDMNSTALCYDKFKLLSECRKTKKQGGVSILVRTDIDFVERHDLKRFEEGKFESIFIEVRQKGKNSIVVGEVYRVPGTSEIDFIEAYDTIVTKIRSENKKAIIGTDQNLDYLKINSHSNTMKFFESNLSNHMIPTIYKPTRVTHSTATLIDNIYVETSLYNNVKSFIIQNDISDHYMCLALIQSNINKKCVKRKVSIRKITDDVMRNMCASLSMRNWCELRDMTIDDGSDKLLKEMQIVVDHYAPCKMKNTECTRYKVNVPWMTQGLKKSSQKCQTMFKKVAKKPRDSIEFGRYKEYRNIFNTLRRKSKVAYYNDLIEKNRHSSKKLWGILHKLTGKIRNKQDISDEIIVNGVKESDANVISNAFGKHYSEIGKILARKIEEKGNVIDPMHYMRSRTEQSCFFFPTSAFEIETIIRNLKVKDSSGFDEISNKILKKIYPGIIEALEILFNKSLQEGHFPKNMKLAIVKPLYKGKKKTEIVNYRPVSLLIVISKILEKLVNKRITKFLSKFNVLTEVQYGFRSGRSTNDAILDFIGNVVENVNKGSYTVSLFLDMSKAFDTVKHETLFKKLEFYGIRGSALCWFKSYLQNRTIKVNYKNVLSKTYEVQYGTPQGSVLGPLIYIILANDLAKTLKFCSCVTFADDTTVFASGNNLRFLYRKINADLEILSKWFDSNTLTLNVEKSKYMVFRPKSKKELSYRGKIKLGDKEMERVENIKFLGIVIDEFLDWGMHLKFVMNKIIAGNYSLSMVKNLLPTDIKLLIYYTNIQSHINYAISAWGPMMKARDISKIKVQQNKAIRLIFNSGKRARLSELYKRSKVLKLEDLMELELLKISYRYINELLPVRISNLFDLSNHSYNTRNRNGLRTAHHTSEKYNKSFLGKAPHFWLCAKESMKNLCSLKSFAKSYINTKIVVY